MTSRDNAPRGQFSLPDLFLLMGVIAVYLALWKVFSV